MFVKPSSAFVEKPSLVASSSGSAKNARYARLFPSTRNRSASRAGASSSCSSAPVSVFGISASLRPMSHFEIVPFADKHVADAAALLAARHARHREAEPLLPELEDPVAAVETDWRADGASGVFASRAGKPAAYLIGAPVTIWSGRTWMRVNVAGLALDGDPETMRDVYAAAA